MIAINRSQVIVRHNAVTGIAAATPALIATTSTTAAATEPAISEAIPTK